MLRGWIFKKQLQKVDSRGRFEVVRDATLLSAIAFKQRFVLCLQIRIAQPLGRKGAHSYLENWP